MKIGSLIRRSNGIYYGVFSYRGKRVWRSTHTTCPEHAKEIVSKMAIEYRTWKNLTITSFRDELVKILQANLALTTILLYKQVLTKFAEIAGDIFIRNVQAYDIEIFKMKRIKEVSPTKVSIDFRTLRSAFTHAKRLKMIETNPFCDCKNVRVPEIDPVYLKRKEFELVLRVIDDKRLRSIVLVAVSTGMRLGEIINLKWDDVDFSSGFIHLKNKEDFTLKGKRKRSIPLNKSALEAIGNMPANSDYVFAKEKLLKEPVTAVSKKFKKCVRKAGLSEKIHFHTLRHTGASWLVQQGVPISFVQRILGHANISTTMIYAHDDHQHLREAVNRIDPLITID